MVNDNNVVLPHLLSLMVHSGLCSSCKVFKLCLSFSVFRVSTFIFNLLIFYLYLIIYNIIKSLFKKQVLSILYLQFYCASFEYILSPHLLCLCFSLPSWAYQYIRYFYVLFTRYLVSIVYFGFLFLLINCFYHLGSWFPSLHPWYFFTGWLVLWQSH